MIKFLCSLLVVVFLVSVIPTKADDLHLRQRTVLNDDWKFVLGDPAEAQDPQFKDEAWRTVNLPHDWSIEGRFDAHAPMGGAGGFLPAGIGWYRKQIKSSSDWTGKQVSLEFEGVYMNADVWLNGQHLASHPYGYTSFFVDLTPALKIGESNMLAVRVDNSKQKNSRWYSGSGIYRHVWLTVTGNIHVAPWGVFVAVPKANSDAATVTVQTRIINDGNVVEKVKIHTSLLSPEGTEVGTMDSDCAIPPQGDQEVNQQTDLPHPALWSPETPLCSRAVTQLLQDGREVDRVSTTYGIRSLTWSADLGLLLNGTSVKLNGGCIHGDNGVLGVAAFDRAEERKIELLKAAGFNEVRTAHAPPSPALLDACDRLGMLVMEDSFDCWAKGKNPFDYSVIFKDWWARDIDSMVMRDRNHPSVIFWNIGNEVPDVYSAMGVEYSSKLVARIHALDNTRPVTNAIFSWPKEDQKDFAEGDWNAEDIVGTNYALSNHIRQHAQFPNRVLVSTESSPGNPINGWASVTKNVYVVGDNVWSAQDYLGESGIGRWFYVGDPTEPVDPPKDANDKTIHPIGHGNDRLYPWHGSLCGDLDLLGNRKPMSHWRSIVWDKGEKLYLAVRQPEDNEQKVVFAGWGWHPAWESWTWPGWEGKAMEVEVYSRYNKARLYLNDQQVGESEITDKQAFKATFKVPYQPGKLKVVGLQDDREVEAFTLATVDAPARIRLTPDRTVIQANGQDLSFVKVEVLDKNDQLQPNADNEISFGLTGAGSIAGLGSANMKSEEPYQGTQCRVFHGEALVVIRSNHQPGPIELQAHASGLADGLTAIRTTAAK
jgi:beta-galactosidase